MAGTRPWTDQDTTELRHLHAEGRSLHSIAKTMGRSKGTISTRAESLDLSWSRERTAKAAEAVQIDNRARRAGIVARLYGQAETELARLEQAADGWRTILKGEHGRENEAVLDFAPPRDRRDVADIVNRHMVSATRLEAVDAGEKPQAVRDLLTGLADRLGVVDGP